MASTQYVSGLDALNAALAQLPERIAKNVLRGAVSAGAAVIRKEAIRLAPVYIPGADGNPPDNRKEPGVLKRAIFQRHAPEKSSELVQVYQVAVRQGKDQRNKQRGKSIVNMDAFYASWVEFGHYYVPPRPKGTTRKQHRAKFATPPGMYVPPKPFMRPAFEGKKTEAVRAIEEYLRQRLPKEFEKAGLTYADSSRAISNAA